MKDRDSLVRSSGIISAATLGSRVLGLVRDNLIATFFSKSLTVPFFTAFLIPNTLRRLFAEGALSAAFIPVFTECLQKEGRERAARLGSSLLKVLFLWLLLVSILGTVFAPQIVQLLPTEEAGAGQVTLTVQLFRIMFPYILLIGLSAATMGMLNSLGKFFAPAISPALLNAAMIGSILAGGIWLTDAPLIRVLAFGVLLGGVLQFLVQVVPLERRMPLGLGRSPLWDPKLRRVLWLMLPLAFGQAITEVNILISAYFAWTIPGAMADLFYSNRIIQFPLGVFGIAIATAAFPRLSRDAVQEEGRRRAVADTLTYTLAKVFFIMLPSAVGIVVLGRDVIGAILDHGAFQREGSLAPTFACAISYAVGLPAFASVKIIVSAFYARQDTRTPTAVGAVAVAANILLIILLKGPLGAAGLALATSLASYLSLLILTGILTGKLHLPVFRRLGAPLLRSGLCALLMGLGVWAVGTLLPEPGGRFALYLLRLAVLLPLGTTLYLLSSWFVQREETKVIIRAFAERWGKGKEG